MTEHQTDLIFNCPHCATAYHVMYNATVTKDSGSAYCKKCRKKMSEWNDQQPSFIAVSEKLRDEWPTNTSKSR